MSADIPERLRDREPDRQAKRGGVGRLLSSLMCMVLPSVVSCPTQAQSGAVPVLATQTCAAPTQTCAAMCSKPLDLQGLWPLWSRGCSMVPHRRHGLMPGLQKDHHLRRLWSQRSLRRLRRRSCHRTQRRGNLDSSAKPEIEKTEGWHGEAPQYYPLRHQHGAPAPLTCPRGGQHHAGEGSPSCHHSRQQPDHLRLPLPRGDKGVSSCAGCRRANRKTRPPQPTSPSNAR